MYSDRGSTAGAVEQANFLHISPRTLEKWELGTSQPNEQASTLLALTDKYPDMFTSSVAPATELTIRLWFFIRLFLLQVSS